MICPTTEAECFFCEGWTGQISLKTLANFSPLSFRGDAPASSPESISPLAPAARWIPGSSFGRPGMTAVMVAGMDSGSRYAHPAMTESDARKQEVECWSGLFVS
jgi:hypothetical protein